MAILPIPDVLFPLFPRVEEHKLAKEVQPATPL